MPQRRISDLSEGELHLMGHIWELGEGGRQDLEGLYEGNDFAGDLDRLVADGVVVTRTADGRTVYATAVPEHESYQSVVKDVADRFFGGSRDRLIQSFTGGAKLNAAEREAIEKHIDKLDESP